MAFCTKAVLCIKNAYRGSLLAQNPLAKNEFCAISTSIFKYPTTFVLRIVEKHGLVADVEKGSDGAAVGALLVRIIRVGF